MKKSPDLSETLSKGANEAKEILQRTAGLIEDEWKRAKGNLEESETVPDGVKSAVNRLGEAVDEMREFVSSHGPQVVSSATNAARQAGVPIPDSWGGTTDGEDGDDEPDPADGAPEDTTDEATADDDADTAAASDEATADEDTVDDDADTAAASDEDGDDLGS